LPGVAQIFWVMHYCEELLGITSNFRGFNQLKFSMPILPGTTVQLELTFDATRSWVMFKFFNTQGSMSSGKILLG